MKFKVDENLPAEIASDLRAAGQIADTVFDEGWTGAVDSVLLARLLQDGRALFTMDKGLGDIRVYPPQNYAGIVLFRPRMQGRGATLAFVRQHLSRLLQIHLSGRLVIVNDAGIRVR
jgi:predicted nuclease of predicted toxin-antitoxin system